VNSTVAMSAAPIGMPGWPEFAACTASMESARMALAMSAWLAGRACGGTVTVAACVMVLGNPAYFQEWRREDAGQSPARQPAEYPSGQPPFSRINYLSRK
jgi:hypothetical protein